jgi:hypothetical protein
VGYLKGGGFQKNPHNSGNETASNQRLKPSADTVTKVLNIFVIALHGVCNLREHHKKHVFTYERNFPSVQNDV